MKTAGIIGGIGPASTIAYYRLIIEHYRQQKPDGSYPHLIINSIDLNRMRGLFEENRLSEVTDYLSGEIRKLAEAGAEVGALSANTPHLVFDALCARSPIPLISIVEVTRRAARERGWKRIGLLGTRFTMQAPFYFEVFAQANIALAVPTRAEQDYIHQKYMSELVDDLMLPETRDRIMAIIERLRVEERIEAVILGGTELPLLLDKSETAEVPFLDTTRLHVEEIVARILS